jgi:hypothetical protein
MVLAAGVLAPACFAQNDVTAFRVYFTGTDFRGFINGSYVSAGTGVGVWQRCDTTSPGTNDLVIGWNCRGATDHPDNAYTVTKQNLFNCSGATYTDFYACSALNTNFQHCVKFYLPINVRV